MNEIFITSDLHFGHNKNFIYEPRGFNSIEEHDSILIENWNNIVSPSDKVFILGDLMLQDNEAGIKKINALNGEKHILFGNHDTFARQDLYLNNINNAIIRGYSTILKQGKWTFYLCHYPTLIGEHKNSDIKFYNLCGHIHTNNKWLHWDEGYKIYHVEPECHNNFPINIEQIISDIKEKRI